MLHVANKWGNGGVERYIESLIHYADPNEFDMTVASVHTTVDSSVVDSAYGPLVGAKSGIGETARSVERLVAYLDPDIVHIHTNNGTGFDYARASNRALSRVCVVHSHNTAFDKRLRAAKRVYTSISRSLNLHYMTHAWACSFEAGVHLFGNAYFDVKKNGVDTRRFAYSPITRSVVRRKLGIADDSFVLGFVARLTEAKNPLFAFEIFKEVVRRLPRSHFIVVGDGPLMGSLKSVVAETGFTDRCFLLGYQESPERYYSAMDVLIAPSLHEGLPINLVEAQTNGLAILASDSITDEVILRKASYGKRSLSEMPEKWCDGIESLVGESSISRPSAWKDIANVGYDVKDTVSDVLESYKKAIRQVDG